MSKLKTITVVDASDFPSEVDDWCIDQEISIHYQNDIIQLEDDGNPFAEWLKSQGYEFKYRKSENDYPNWDDIGIFAT
jgi:hypothetical protein